MVNLTPCFFSRLPRLRHRQSQGRRAEPLRKHGFLKALVWDSRWVQVVPELPHQRPRDRNRMGGEDAELS